MSQEDYEVLNTHLTSDEAETKQSPNFPQREPKTMPKSGLMVAAMCSCFCGLSPPQLCGEMKLMKLNVYAPSETPASPRTDAIAL